jgi:hypothetical protein
MTMYAKAKLVFNNNSGTTHTRDVQKRNQHADVTNKQHL